MCFWNLNETVFTTQKSAKKSIQMWLDFKCKMLKCTQQIAGIHIELVFFFIKSDISPNDHIDPPTQT